ncbi:hypothetical protein LOTGIDRAFT_150088 [Lottia gigantea]|uniref:TP53 regulated inhibitor of apoptosis 1 n=1 Tax=Lottia gigantea TaxID=225164 RepID=V4AEJ8_LOTGI|nr:hypothetical protein LOTGIDRAFT_150088 [Lottia gigantea]ESO95307.1 hypothetical protein LOTGIDRAFT_150088 [Lottia gigantea]
MESIGSDCLELKLQYDKCFNKWFAEKYLKGVHQDECAHLFKPYQDCVKKALQAKGLEEAVLHKDVLGTVNEKPPPPKS